MESLEIQNLSPDNSFFVEIFPDIWLMDNHKWAYYIWEKYDLRNVKGKPFALFHADYHWDAVNDFQDKSDIQKLAEIESADQILELVSNDEVRKDAFIAPAIIRGFINEVHFYCKQNDTDEGFWSPFLEEYEATQYFHNDIDSFISYSGPKKKLFDLDIDLFNKSGIWNEGDLWDEKQILHFLESCSGLIKSSEIVTIAMSFHYSGDTLDTRYLTEVVTSYLESII